MKTENFLPFSKRELLDHLAAGITDKEERESFAAFARLVEAVYHFRFYRDLEELKAAYAPLDPDRSTIPIAGTGSAGPVDLYGRIGRILVAANYREITKERLEEAFGQASPWGLELEVDLDDYEFLSLHSRGEYPESLTKRSFFMKRKFDYSVFRNVALVFKLKEGYHAEKQAGHTSEGRYRSDKVYLKLFKNVPTVDLEMLFPDTAIKIRLFDKLKVIAPLAAGAVSSLYKIASYILGHGNGQLLWTQIGFWTLMGGLFGIALKGFFSYRNTVEKYLKSLTESLYFQNLDNNSGVFKYLLDDAEEEECKELILGYYFLRFEGRGGLDATRLDERIEAYFRDELGTAVDFEVEDSLRKMRELGLLASSDGGLSVLPLSEARRILERDLLAGVL
jgi:hypothetical protein